jgi:hypothetical protein
MADKRKQVEGLIARQRKLGEEMLAIADDLEALINGEDTTGQQVNKLMGAWSSRWQVRYKRAYVFTARAKAAAGFKRLLKGMDADDIETRMVQYLQSTDSFYATSRHSLDLFFTSVNKFPGNDKAIDDAEFLTAPVADCSHAPRCKSDQEHTRRRAAEMRA